MGTRVFVTRWWPWTLIHNGVRRLHIYHVSTIIPYLPNSHFSNYPTAPHFYYRLIQCKIYILYLLDYMLYYDQSKTLFHYNELYVTISLSQNQTMRAPSDDAIFKCCIFIKSFLPVNLWYTTADLNGDLQECMHFLLLKLILLGMINTFNMWKR